MDVKELQIGQLYHPIGEGEEFYLASKKRFDGTKRVCIKDILLFVKMKDTSKIYVAKHIFSFLDKDGEELWFQEKELDCLERVDGKIET